MPITITLDDKLAAGLESSARRQHLTVEQFALNVLAEVADGPDELSLEELVKKIQAMPPNPASIQPATGDFATAEHLTVEEHAMNVMAAAADDPDELSLEELVKKIQAMPPNPASIRPATGDLAAALRAIPDDPTFDEQAWNRDWAAIQAEMKAVTRANDIAEGRG